MLRVLHNKGFRLFWAGQGVSRIGDACFAIALGWLILDLTDSTVALGTVMLLMSLPEVLLSIIGGSLVDRFDLRKLMISTDVIFGLLTGSLWAFDMLGALTIWHIYAVALFYGTVQSVFSPIYLSAMPRLVKEQELYDANRLFTTTEQAAVLAGAPLAGFLVTWLGAAPAILMDSLSFFVSALCVYGIDRAIPPEGLAEEPLLRSVSGAVAYLKRHRNLLGLLALRALGNLGYAPFMVLLVVWVREVAHGGPEMLGWLSMTLSVGGLAGSFWGLRVRGLTTGQTILGANVALGALVALFALLPWWSVAFVLAPLIGYVESAEIVLVNLVYQRIVNQGYLGRIGSVRVVVAQSLSTVGQGLSGWASALFGVGPTILVGGVLLALTGGVIQGTTSIESIDVSEAETVE